MFLTLNIAVLLTTQGLYNRQTMQSKGLIITAIISTYLQLVHAHLITCQFLVILDLKHFAFGLFFMESET